jgi:hypothetical protein
MTVQPDNALLSRYLLHQCSEDERTQVEDRFFEDDELFERLRQLEEDAVERYLRGDLTAEEREQFDRAYASPPRRDRVRFARALTTLSASRAEAAPAVESVGRRGVPTRFFRRPFAWSYGLGLAAALLLVSAATVITFWQARQLRTSLGEAEAQNRTLERERENDRQRLRELEKRTVDLGDELNRARASQPSPGTATRPQTVVAAFVLSPGLLRSAQKVTRVVVPRAVEQVRLQLDLEPGTDYRSYRVEVRNIQGAVVWSQEMLRPRRIDSGTAVSVWVPAERMNAGEHEAVLSGSADSRKYDDAGHYYFDVVKP